MYLRLNLLRTRVGVHRILRDREKVDELRDHQRSEVGEKEFERIFAFYNRSNEKSISLLSTS